MAERRSGTFTTSPSPSFFLSPLGAVAFEYKHGSADNAGLHGGI